MKNEKNDKIINAWDKMKPSAEIKQEILSDIMQKQNQREKPAIFNPFKSFKSFRSFRPARLAATAAAVMLLVGLINIQTVLAFINGLFFVPGVGLTNDADVKYYGLESPIVLKMDSGTVTIQFISKVTINDKTELSMYVDSFNNFAYSLEANNAVLSISADGKEIIPNVTLSTRYSIVSGSLTSSYDGKSVSYHYFNEDFPDINEFDLSLFGLETRISLVEQPGNAAISQTNNGITFAAYKFNGVRAFIATDIYDENAGDDYWLMPHNIPLMDIYGENGETILCNGGGSAGNFSYWLARFVDQAKTPEVKGIKTNAVAISYIFKNDVFIEFPIPQDGETIETDIKIQVGSQTLKITEVRREGDIIYYESNICRYARYDSPPSGLEYAAANREAYISAFSVANWETDKAYLSDNEISNFDLNAETIIFRLHSVDITQYGDFDIEFD